MNLTAVALNVMHEPVTALRLTTGDPSETQALAAALAAVLVDGDLLVLTGDLGAGKTCFSQGLGRGLGIEERITSPTFTLANRYHGRLTMHHLDVYRLDTVAESADLGLSELLEDGVTVIEWGDRIAEVLPVDHLLVALRYPDLETALDGADADGADATGVAADEHRELVLSWSGNRWSDRDLPRLLSRWSADEVIDR